MSKKKKGFIPVMLTPFQDDGCVDYDGLDRLTTWYIQAGASGLFANCLSSEMFDLTEKERLAITKQVVKVANGLVPVVATATFGGPVNQQADFIKRMYETGIDAAIVITNMLADENESTEIFNERVFRLLDATIGIPLGFYECPEPFKRVLTAAQLKLFVETGRIIYHKDTCLDMELVRAKLAATTTHPEFGLYDAYMVHAVESLRAGSAGLSCIQGNYFPELVVWLCDHYNDESKQEELALVQQFFIEHMDVMHAVYPVVAKYFLQERGLAITNFTRKSVGSLTIQLKADMEKLNVAYEQLFRTIGLNPIE